jgi:hypothetical protein
MKQKCGKFFLDSVSRFLHLVLTPSFLNPCQSLSILVNPSQSFRA